MRTRIFRTFATGIVLLAYGPSTLAQQPDCAAFIRDAFNISITREGATSSSSYKKWQCSVELSNHDEAIATGLNVGAVVYGVPISVGGSFDKNNVESWKKTNCSDEQRTADSQSTKYTFIKTYAPEAAALAAKCIDATYGRRAIGCTLEGGATPVFTAEWRRTDGDAKAPTVQQFTVEGGSCSPTFKEKDVLPEGGKPAICTPQDGKDMVIALETDRGSCFQTRSFNPLTEVLAGKVVLTGNRIINADVIDIRNDADIVTNGYQLTLSAAREIKISGSPKLTSFNGVDSATGRSLHGRPGGTLVFQAPRISGGQLTVQNFGEDGQTGARGDTGAKGAKGHGHRLQGLKGCTGKRNGGQGGDGSVGDAGGSGGAGGLVVFNVRDGLMNGAASRVLLMQQRQASDGSQRLCNGSCGGNGGDGGPGGKGGPGGDGDPGKNGCGGASGGPDGPDGPRGKPGQPGSDTAPSTIAS